MLLQLPSVFSVYYHFTFISFFHCRMSLFFSFYIQYCPLFVSKCNIWPYPACIYLCYCDFCSLELSALLPQTIDVTKQHSTPVLYERHSTVYISFLSECGIMRVKLSSVVDITLPMANRLCYLGLAWCPNWKMMGGPRLPQIFPSTTFLWDYGRSPDPFSD